MSARVGRIGLGLPKRCHGHTGDQSRVADRTQLWNQPTDQTDRRAAEDPYAKEDGTRFTNDGTGHGMIVAVDGVQAF